MWGVKRLGPEEPYTHPRPYTGRRKLIAAKGRPSQIATPFGAIDIRASGVEDIDPTYRFEAKRRIRAEAVEADRDPLRTWLCAAQGLAPAAKDLRCLQHSFKHTSVNVPQSVKSVETDLPLLPCAPLPVDRLRPSRGRSRHLLGRTTGVRLRRAFDDQADPAQAHRARTRQAGA